MSRARSQRPTLKLVADATGFSPSTVSRAMRDDPRVKPDTREQIQSVAAALGFTHNALASSLRGGGTSTLIGLLIPDFQDPFFASIAAGAQEAASGLGRELVVGCHNNNSEEQERLIRQMVGHRVEAFIITPTPGQPPAQLLNESRFGTPVVAVDRPSPVLGCDSITSDNEGGARMLAQEMLARGHRRLGIVGHHPSIWTQGIRLQTVLDTLAAEGIPVDADAVVTAEPDGTLASARVEAMLTSVTPTAVISLSAMPLARTYASALHLGMDLDFACFDGHPLFDLLDTRIFCVEQDAAAVGRAAVTQLVERRNQPALPPRHIVVALPTPVVRGRNHGREHQ